MNLTNNNPFNRYGINHFGMGAEPPLSASQEVPHQDSQPQEESGAANHQPSPVVPWWKAVIDCSEQESLSLEDEFPFLKKFDPSQWLDLLFPDLGECDFPLTDQTHSGRETNSGCSIMNSKPLPGSTSLSKRKFTQTDGRLPLTKRVSIETEQPSAPFNPHPHQNGSSAHYYPFAPLPSAENSPFGSAPVPFNPHLPQNDSFDQYYPFAPLPSVENSPFGSTPVPFTPQLPQNGAFGQSHSFAPLPSTGRPPFRVTPPPTFPTFIPSSASFKEMPCARPRKITTSSQKISSSAAPAFIHLSTQMTQAFSHRSANQIPVYEEARENIQKVLRLVLPLIEELDKVYEKMCESFAGGTFPPKPEGMQSDLMPYQWRGYKWMEIFYKFGIGGCLADGMGLGKTIQSIALVQAVINEKNEQGKAARILISCPANLIANWQRELNFHCPGLKSHIDIIEGNQDHSLNQINLISHQKLRLNSPASKEGAKFPFNQEWDLILLDEFHTFLNTKTSEKVITRLRQQAQGPGHGFIALTGTPMPNNLPELYRLNAMLNPNTYPTIGKFEKAVMKPAKDELRKLLLQAQNNGGKIPSHVSLKLIEEHVIQLIEILAKPFLLRRQNHFEEFKAQTAIMQSRGRPIQPLLPIEKEERISYSLSEIQLRLIQTIIDTNPQALDQATERGALSLFSSKIEKEADEASLNLIDYLYLQQVANHPALLLESERLMRYLSTKSVLLHQHIQSIPVNYSEPGKLQAIIHLVKNILDRTPDDKILIFTNFEKMGHLICEGLKASALIPIMQKVKFLYGKVDKNARSAMIEEFQHPEGPPVLVAGRKLGSVGWNCTAANHLIIVDPWWNPNDDDQCIARLHRIGQTKRVKVYRMHRETFVVDDKMNKLRVEKKAWCELILSADTTHVQERIRAIIESPSSLEGPVNPTTTSTATSPSSYSSEAGLELTG
ncbi:DEAD/DEAH box helicase [Candidatus Protochlamydia phocaeensis]|uniref:DEAD/DEAH box helicase n=1 Tax=Candidatus Protochlamydia phocaeensis TaxID=1414722 RepID=UPI000838CE16|nr:DEAD/DEAH box helicase [Candidatus Protochlamydia phocaeensis]